MKARGALDAQECAVLREAQKLVIWRAFGCASLVEYMTREMGYTERAAVERLRVAKVIEEVPALGEALIQGGLSFSGARELSRVVTPETQEEWIAAAQDKNVRQIEDLVSGHKPGDRPTDAPDPALRTKVLRHEVKMAVAELESRARKALQRMRGSSVDDSDFMEACFRAVLDQCAAASSRGAAESRQASREAEPGRDTAMMRCTPAVGDHRELVADECPDGTRADTHVGAFVVARRVLTEADLERLLAPRYQIAVTTCASCKSGWQHGASSGAANSASTLLSPPELERVHCDCVDIGDLDADQPDRAKRSIPKALKRHVLHRDGFKCRVPGCNATANIDCHHVKFVANGGENVISNLVCLCEGHHLAVHAGTLIIEGDATSARFTCSKQSNYKIETRVVECTAALRDRGVPKAAIKAAVAATRTHVGKQDLTAAQWLAIALTKVPTEASTS
ncbi:MAG TPA: hypothetical protein VMZ53_04445 [Kofleriaceae bacterium]|nr:hypothetical protein [Kofleriaceae bacterium]